jgi:hypothetical protein
MIDMKPLVSEESRKVGFKKKDTRRWCKGKPGVEHDFSIVRDAWPMNGNCAYIVDVCAACGKHSGFRANPNYEPYKH